MLGETLLRATVLVAALVTTQVGECVGLGNELFGPEFQKTYEAPTPAEIKAHEEAVADAKARQEADKQMVEALDKSNLIKGPNIDFTQINKAKSLRPNDALYPAARYAMLIAAGKAAEAKAEQDRVDQIFEAEKRTDVALARDRTLAFELYRMRQDLPPNSPALAEVNKQMCVHVKAARAGGDGGGYESECK